MTSKDKHQKHTSLNKPALGEFGRNELAILGTSCGLINDLAKRLIQQLSTAYSVAYVDANHQGADAVEADESGESNHQATMRMTDYISYTQFTIRHPLSAFDKRSFFNNEDLVLLNGNHFTAKSQILIIDSKKILQKNLDRLTDVVLVVLKDKFTHFPDSLKQHLPQWEQKPVFYLEETQGIAIWIKEWMARNISPINGLVLVGGKSKRMEKDKGGLIYHDRNQREHVMELIQPFCVQVFLSCNAQQKLQFQDAYPVIEDSFLGLGPMGGILSAFRHNPNAAWLTVACDLPYLSEATLQYLIAHRNPSKVATAFLDPNGDFPEPLVTLWEPRAYPILLEYLSQGYSCPRKVLINTEIQILEAPDKKEFYNANHPEEYEEVKRELRMESGENG
jgi:molybdopterin-guanine dinucleotide biosynthesis protein A